MERGEQQAEHTQAHGSAWIVPGRTGSSASAPAGTHQTDSTTHTTHKDEIQDASMQHSDEDGDDSSESSSEEEGGGQLSDDAHAASAADKGQGDDEDGTPIKQEPQQSTLNAAASHASSASSSLCASAPLRSSGRASNLLPGSWRSQLEAMVATATAKSRRAASASNTIRKRPRAAKHNKGEAEGAQAAAAAASSSKSTAKSASLSGAVVKKKSGRFVCPFHCSPKAEFALVSRRTIKRHVIECTYRDAKCGKILKAETFTSEREQYEAVKKLLIEEKKFSPLQLKGFVFREHREKRDKWDTPYNSRWYCLNQLRGCEEFYVSTSSSSKTAHTAICPFALAPVKYSPAQLKEIREKLRKEADARAEQATKRLAAEAEAAAAAGDEHAAGGSTKHSHGSKHNKSSSSAVSAGTVLHSSSSSAFRKLHVSSSSAAAAGAPAGPTSGSHFAYVQGTKAAKMISADTAAAAAAVAKKNKRVRAPKATATVAIKDEDDSEFEEDRPASPRSAGKKPPKRARKRSLTTDAITQSTVALAAAAATVSNAAVPPSLTPAAFQAFHSQAAVAVESAQRGNMPPALPLQRQLGFQPKEYLSFAATAGGSGVGGDLTSHFRLAAEQQIQARVMSQGGEGTVASHSPYTTATAVSLGHSPFSQAIAARPLLSQASIFPHNQSAHVTSSPLVDAQLQQQRHQYMPSMYAAAQAAAHSPASTGTLMLTPNPHQPFTPSASATTVAAAASAAAAAAAAHFRLPASVFDPEGVGAPLQIDLLSYKLGLEHAAKAAEQKRQALRAANAGSKRKNGTADAVPSPIVASADVSVKTAPKRAKLPTFSPLLPAAALSGGGFQPQLMPALTIPDPQQQQQLHQHFSLHASETNLSMSRESTAATAVTAPMHGGLDGYGAGELSVNAASMMRAHLAGHSHFSSSHSSPMPRLHMRGGPHETAGRSGVATQEGTCGSSTTSSARVFQSHQSRDGESAEHGLPRCPSPGARAQQQQQRDGWASAPDTSPHLDQQHQLVFSPQIVPKQTVPALQLEGVVDGDRDRDAADADTGSPIVETSFAEGQQSHHMHAKLSFEPASKLDLMGGGGGVAVEEGNVIVAHSSGADSVMRTPRLNQFVTDGDLRPLFSPGDLPAAVLSSTGATAVGSGVASTPRSGGPGLQYPSSPLPNPPVLSRSLCMLGGGKANSRPNSSLGDMMQRITQQQQQQQQQQAQQATAPTQQAHSPMRIQASVQPPPDDLLARLEAQRADLIRQLEVQQRLLRAQNALAQATQQEDPSLMQLQLEAKELARQRSYLIQLQRLQIDQAAAMREANAPFLSQFASVPPPQMNAQTLAHIMQQTQLGQARQQQAHQQWMQQEAEQQRRVASMRSAAAPLSVLHSPLLSSVPPPPPAPLPSDPSRRQLLHRMHALTTEQLHDIFRTHQRAT